MLIGHNNCILTYGNFMRKIFTSGEIYFYSLNNNESEEILNNLEQTCGLYQINDNICKNDLNSLPSPVQSPDFVACFTSGEIPTTTSMLGNTVIDVIRRETNPRHLEPDYNVYRHFIVKTSDDIYISEPVKPDHHWLTSGELSQIYKI